jgi:anhydro-N-acetylmuramic acid kinase
MNLNIESLYNVAKRPYRRIIGLMSGTSLDGLDMALCKITGSGVQTSVEIEVFETEAYSDDIRKRIRNVFAKDQVDFPYLVMLNAWLGGVHAHMIRDFLERNGINPADVDLIASHGQTVMHVPAHQHGRVDFPNATLQIGDGDHIAVKTGITTISDFRQKHIAAGGEGAPLAVYGDYLVFSKMGEDRIMLNMGGIGNFTFLSADGDPGKVFVSDTGPGNTLMDAWILRCRGEAYDRDAAMAREGQAHEGLLRCLKEHSFFSLPFPKSTGPEVFHIRFVEECLSRAGVSRLSDEDVMATLNMFSAQTIVDGIVRNVGPGNCHVYTSGGGMHNPLLTENIQRQLPGCIFAKTEDLGIPGDSKEAMLFAVLANEAVAGSTIDFGKGNHIPAVTMGKISFAT